MGARQNRQGTLDGSSILLTQKDIFFPNKLVSFSHLQNKLLPTYGINYVIMYNYVYYMPLCMATFQS